MPKLLLIRYDTESTVPDDMTGFLEKAVSVHREHAIPATFFCTGAALDTREDDFRSFYREVTGDPLFDLQNHSYSHIGLGYEAGKPVEVLQDDYSRSFDSHERVFGVRPKGISICGTGGKDGPRLTGFDATDKGKAELAMVIGLGIYMINTHLTGVAEDRAFTDYSSLGFPDVMGFPSGYSDTSWMYRKEHGDPVEYILGEIKKRSAAGEHIPVMLHDWCAWNFAADKELTHVIKIADTGRQLGYELATHFGCYGKPEIWKG